MTTVPLPHREDWPDFRHHWSIDPDCIYLNHGSFGPSPICVQERRRSLIDELESQPMSFLVRKLPDYFQEAATALASFLRCEVDSIAFVPNATSAMNVVAQNLDLSPDDEVLLTDHEYGAVVRIWGQRCARSGAKTTRVRLPDLFENDDEIVEAIAAAVSPKTKVLVVSHVTSATGLILPIQKICRAAKERGLIVVVDGPHAPAMVNVNLEELDCDFYCASCHKWMSAAFGSGFLYVRRRYKQGLMPTVTSWGRNLDGREFNWRDEFHWPGTVDPTTYLTVGTAISFLEEIGLPRFREQTHSLAQYARVRLLELTERSPLSTDSDQWNGSMVTVPIDVPIPENLKPHDPHPLQRFLASQGVETLFVDWRGECYLRVSCHLYNSPEQIDRLIELLLESKMLQSKGD
ncbi:Isopenicillin N epimerase [Thalassoglobus neptunius]|uniref:Isopenicillin N epimerase n=1 Tax=Thalassoglobus neptunius TaxID=1938619 RepID=A0A5C5W0M2_9PLAN|nr:aminotransferase class V-fold PLP-dependent enzyme [Thalassoglobus neptunius]TWT43531.1 Isopenicillin N epimerase [Thalassoglobus neptunius]